MASLKRTLSPILVLSCLFAPSCGTNIAKTLRDLVLVRSEIVKKFGDEVNVRVSAGKPATILATFINSALNEKSEEERLKRAQETAEVVKANYGSIKTIDEIWVGFARQTTRYAFFHFTEGLGMYGFDNNAQPLQPLEGSSSDEVGSDLWPRANYSAYSRRSDISWGIQLEGEAGAGLTMIPHFSVPGDANHIQPKPPAEVGFDFASYAKKQKFPGLTDVLFLADGKIVFHTDGQFSTSKSADNMISEFLYVKVPYRAFRQLTSAAQVTIKLGEHHYQLTSEEIEGLRRMTHYVKP